MTDIERLRLQDAKKLAMEVESTPWRSQGERQLAEALLIVIRSLEAHEREFAQMQNEAKPRDPYFES